MQTYVLLITWMISLLNTGDRTTVDNRSNTIACAPVKLLAFSGKSNDGRNTLQWQTVSEVNTREFIVERSADGATFTLYAWVTPKGTANGPAMYRYIDTASINEAHYRLRMVDADGKEQVSRTIFLSVKSTGK